MRFPLVHIHTYFLDFSLNLRNVSLVINSLSPLSHTDIPLLPTTGNSNDQLFHFQLNWLNNKELQFTTEAEKILQEMHKHTSLNDGGMELNSWISDTAVSQQRNGATEEHNDTDPDTGSQPDETSAGNLKTSMIS